MTESSWPEVYQKLKADMEIWMLGTGLETRIANLVNFDRRRVGLNGSLRQAGIYATGASLSEGAFDIC